MPHCKFGLPYAAHLHKLTQSMKPIAQQSITQIYGLKHFIVSLILCCACTGPVSAADGHTNTDAEQFILAWDAARRGDHVSFRKIKQNLQTYLLYPYLQYEDYRNRRSRVPADEMSVFLSGHQDWAFAEGLTRSWLTSLAKKGRWSDLVKYSDGVTDTTLRCQRARGRIIVKQIDGLLTEAQALWTVGKSQVDECDPVFNWLIRNDGIHPPLAWERIRLAMLAGNPRLTLYLARFIPKDQRHWLEAWQDQARRGYTRLERMSGWPDNEVTGMITSASLQILARKDASLAAEKFQALDPHFTWGDERRADLLRDIALYAAVDLNDDTSKFMASVPPGYHDSQLLEWWARYLLSVQDWSQVAAVIGQMPENTRTDERWRYWLAQAELKSGIATDPAVRLSALSREANYYGFLAADELGQPYNICPLQPGVSTAEAERIAALDGFLRALELRRVGLDNWSTQEWSMAAQKLPTQDLKSAAALAHREDWHDRAIFALGNSGDLRFYEWRFPLLWKTEIQSGAVVHNLDPAWVYGTIRSESAMLETAVSSANAMGLMQVTPDTGKRVSKRHGIPWTGSAQLKTAKGNLPLGMAYMGDLMQDYQNNPVLVLAAYNAGPTAVERWLDERPRGDTSIWVETLPYFETRDYIPRVLAFTTLYDWRLGGTVKRISARMPHIDSGKISINGSTGVVCNEPD